MESTTASADIANLPLQISFLHAAKLLGYKSDMAAYAARSRGRFPLCVRACGGVLIVFKSDLIRYLENGEFQPSTAPKMRPSRHDQAIAAETAKRGAPTIAERMAADAAGLSVKEYREAMAA